ncbi:hypothetical protein [Stieleria sp.]|uniref:Uncharacterized protein n=1 Tax=Stieleria magnilauensis TaxID=2527963 RepID=A0ABX5XT53_9BACT|nr:hypothetical protein TBK1r_27640 [Planctomycetes bacterium TBK1r]
MPLSGRDIQEGVAGSDAHRLYGEVEDAIAANTYSESELRVVNAVRELYRRAAAETPGGAGALGGSRVFEGGHVLLNDKGTWYTWLKARAGKSQKQNAGQSRVRWSSHESTSQNQYEIPLGGLGCILFGKINGKTWFQNEAHAATTTLSDSILHGLDWVKHKWSGNQQVGALGYSPFSEKNGTHLVLSHPPSPDDY